MLNTNALTFFHRHSEFCVAAAFATVVWCPEYWTRVMSSDE